MPPSFINALGMWMVPFGLFPHFRYVCILYYNYLQMDLIGTDSSPDYLNSQTALMYLFVKDEILFFFYAKHRRGRREQIWERHEKLGKMHLERAKGNGKCSTHKPSLAHEFNMCVMFLMRSHVSNLN